MAEAIRLVILACVLHLTTQEEPGIKSDPKVAVMEYNAKEETSLNIKEYEGYIDFIHNYFYDVIVFPEKGLTTNVRDATPVPNPEDKIIPHKNDVFNKYPVVSAISKAAAVHKIYVVVNLFERVNCSRNTTDCPDRGYFIYNTNVAFDRNGMVIARYRKYNVYDEKNVDRPKSPDLSTFTTDFGVTFGLFTCFDILFKTPAIDLHQKYNVNNFIFTTHWYGELPFLTAVQIQDGWSYSTNTNLLASGANKPEKGTTGSGVYLSRKSKLAWMGEIDSNKIIMSGLPVNKTQGRFQATVLTKELPSAYKGLKLLEDPTINSTHGKDLDFNAGKFEERISHNGLCCRFSLKYRKSSVCYEENYTYRAVVFQGERTFGGIFKHEVAYCAVVLCVGGNCAKKPPNGKFPLIFDEIAVVGDFKGKSTLQIPNTLIWQDGNPSMLLDTMEYGSFSYETKANPGTDMKTVSINLKKSNVSNLITFGIFGRIFD